MELVNNRVKKIIFVKDLLRTESVEGMEILEPFVLKDIKYSSNANGNKWQILTLEDITGVMSAKIWVENIRPEYENYKGEVVLVRGKVTVYEGKPDLAIMQMQPILNYFVEDYKKSLDEDTAEMYRCMIKNQINKTSENYKQMLSAVFTDEVLEKMSVCPADVFNHHCYYGGLLEHTYDVLMQVIVVGRGLNQDLLIAGALLHDIGVIESICLKGLVFENTYLGRFVGSNQLSVAKTLKQASRYLISEEEIATLVNIVSASHEQSPIGPATKEAIVVKNCNKISIENGIYDATFEEFDKKYVGNKVDVLYSNRLEAPLLRRKDVKLYDDYEK